MKIESLIKRKNGTQVQLEAPRRLYHFKPESGVISDPHVCDVEIESHAKALLKIREGFRLVDGEQAPEMEELEERRLNGSSVHDAHYTIKGGEVIELADLVNMAFDDSGLDEDEWNALADQQRYVYIDATLRELKDGFNSEEVTEQPVLETQPTQPEEQKSEEKSDELPSRKELVEQFKAKFGRNPSNKMKPEEIARALSEDDDE